MQFVIPKDSTFLSIENIAIPINSHGKKSVYQFINHLYKKKNLADACNEFGVFPATITAKDFLKYQNEFEEIESQITKPGYQLHFFSSFGSRRGNEISLDRNQVIKKRMV